MHIACTFSLFKPVASLTITMISGIDPSATNKELYLSRVAVIKVVLSFYFVCLT